MIMVDGVRMSPDKRIVLQSTQILSFEEKFCDFFWYSSLMPLFEYLRAKLTRAVFFKIVNEILPNLKVGL